MVFFQSGAPALATERRTHGPHHDRRGARIAAEIPDRHFCFGPGCPRPAPVRSGHGLVEGGQTGPVHPLGRLRRGRQGRVVVLQRALHRGGVPRSGAHAVPAQPRAGRDRRRMGGDRQARGREVHGDGRPPPRRLRAVGQPQQLEALHLHGGWPPSRLCGRLHAGLPRSRSRMRHLLLPPPWTDASPATSTPRASRRTRSS